MSGGWSLEWELGDDPCMVRSHAQRGEEEQGCGASLYSEVPNLGAGWGQRWLVHV